jgi:amino acid adenylation domain-containing protein
MSNFLETAQFESPADWFTGLMETHPNRILFEFEGSSLTVSELNRKANGLALRLRERGVAPNDLIALHLDRSLELMVALLAVLKVGGAYLPLDPSYPSERIRYMLSDSFASVVLCEPTQLEFIREIGERAMILESDRLDEVYEDVHTQITPEMTAYLLYTSGSTGSPKGVVISYGAIVNHMEWLFEEFEMGVEDKILIKTPISFDASVWELFAPLMCGATGVIALNEGHRDIAYLSNELQNRGITILQVVPSLLNAMLHLNALDDCARLRIVFSGGEALSSTLVQSFHQACGAELVNLYGPTEATIDSLFWRCSRDELSGEIPIGRPIRNVLALALDEDMVEVEEGESGELWLGGPALAHGYFNQPALTSERFVPHQLAPPPSGRLYKTGDLVKRQPGNVFLYKGRIDNQVKLRGYRIELEEVESALKRAEGVRDAVVVLQEPKGKSAHLASFILGTWKDGFNDAGIREFLLATIPEYMIPAEIIVVDSYPQMPNGKIDRKALAGFDSMKLCSSPETSVSMDPVQAAIADIWKEVLSVEVINSGDNFFKVGGQSLLARTYSKSRWLSVKCA